MVDSGASQSNAVGQASAAVLSFAPGRWLHRIAVLIVCLVWPLIGVGGQVTTYDAGMAVPDWPGTYGYNLFLYPYQTWIYGPFNLFIEHGHRLLGGLVGFVAIIGVIAAFYGEPRRWVRWIAIGVLVAISLQGVLGGVRVLMHDRHLALLHGCLAQLVFTLCVVQMVVTSRWWWGSREQVAALAGVPSRGLFQATGLLVGLCYLQVILGANLRHLQPTASPGGFTHVVATHMVVALLVLLVGLLIAWRIRAARLRGCVDLTLSRPAGLLVILIVIQISLGLATWVARYGVPQFAQIGPRTASYLVRSQALAESLIITGHVVTGALVLVTAALLLLRLGRVRYLGNSVQ